MEVDENEFFREVTLRVCGSLEIERALWQSLMYICDYLPADGMTLSTYKLEQGTSRIIAMASREGGRTLSTETPQALKARRMIEKWYRQPEESLHVRIIESVKRDPLMAPVVKAMGVPDVPALQMLLKLEGKMLGTLVVTNIRGRKYTQEHARLLMTVNEPYALALSNSLRYREVLRLKESLADDNRYLQKELRRFSGDKIIGADLGLKRVMELVNQVAPMDSPVLLLGETGTGKELIANAIHNLSARWEGPFIAVNCGAVSPTLMDSELFGHEKGAFTGAQFQKRGRFERAHGGTIFLDEIGELTPDAQVRLLRVLQEKEIERVGGTRSIPVDIRVIAATHRNLEEMLHQGRFREDLYFRLRVFPITIPPLRERKADISALVRHFIWKKAQEMRMEDIPSLAQDALETLTSYHWPGNVRELENAVERALILKNGGMLSFPELKAPMLAPAGQEQSREMDETLALDAVVSRHISRVLEMTGGQVHGPSGAANLLQVNPSTLRKRMKKLGIAYGRQRKG